MDEESLAYLGDIGDGASLRHAVQLLTPASVLAKTNGRDEIAVGDLEEVGELNPGRQGVRQDPHRAGCEVPVVKRAEAVSSAKRKELRGGAPPRASFFNTRRVRYFSSGVSPSVHQNEKFSRAYFHFLRLGR